MKVKFTTVRVNLIALLRKIEQLESTEEINYEIIQKVNEINKKLSEAENIIEEIESYIND